MRMRRGLLTGVCIIWTVMILACTGAGGKWFDLPGGQSISRSDYWDYYFDGNNGVRQIGGHITEVGFDHQFILLRRDVCKRIDRRRFDGRTKLTYELTGAVEFYIMEVSPPKLHGPLTEAEFRAARERLGVPAELPLEPTDKVRARLSRQ